MLSTTRLCQKTDYLVLLKRLLPELLVDMEQTLVRREDILERRALL